MYFNEKGVAMTKEQKTKYVLGIVTETRRFFVREELVGMVNFIWDGLDGADSVAREPNQLPLIERAES
jgi:hypothetical protein